MSQALRGPSASSIDVPCLEPARLVLLWLPLLRRISDKPWDPGAVLAVPATAGRDALACMVSSRCSTADTSAFIT